MRRVLRMATTLAVVLAAGSVVRAQGIDTVPENAVFMVKVNNLEGTSKKLSVLFKQWGVDQMEPMLADPLGALQNMGNLQKGLNKAGEAAFVVFNPSEHRGAEPYVVLLPVSDYQAFLGNFEDAQPDGDAHMISLPGSGEEGYVAKWGAFAAISPSRDLVEPAPEGSKPAGVSAKHLASRDVIAYVNFAGFRDQAVAGLGFGRAMAIQGIDRTGNGNPEKAKYAPMMKAAANQAFNGIEHVLNETQSITLSANLSETGVQLTYMLEFTPESYLGKYAAGWKTPAAAVAGLPQQPYVMVGTSLLDSATSNKLIDDMVGPVLDEARLLGAEGQGIVDYVEGMKEMIAATRGQSFGATVGQGKVGEGAMIDLVSVSKGDAKQLQASQAKVAAGQEQFQKLMQMESGDKSTQSLLAKDARKLEGVSFDELTTTAEEGTAEAKMIEMIYGKGGFKALMGATDPQTLLVTTYQDEARLKKVIGAARGNKDLLAQSAPTKQVAAKLPSSPFISAYFYGDQLMALASRISEAVSGQPLEATIPADVEPAGMALSTEGSAVKVDFYFPSPLIQSAVQYFQVQSIKEHQQQEMDEEL